MNTQLFYKNYKIAFLLSLALVAFLAGVFLVGTFFFNDIKWSENEKFFIAISITIFFVFCFVFLNIRFERVILNKVEKLYDDLSPSGVFPSTSVIQTDLEEVKKSLLKFADDKKFEIEKLKDQEKYRREFIGNIAHELKTPLFTVQGYILTLLEREINDEELKKKYLKRTSKGLDRLVHIVRDLDLITAFESGVKSIEKSKFDLMELIKNIIDLFEMQLKKNNVSLSVDGDDSLTFFVEADKERIQQVLTNLIINSLKYSVEKGSIEISINKLNKNKLIVDVTDNGEGIEEKHLPRIFERFYRIDKTRNRKLGGSGLGLAIVKHIIQAHGERVFVESKFGVGSKFSFTLEIAK
ncbi:MAG: two-component sensor histidine kinase [Flavobacteriaceae bacterium]|nr:two-component sensor histidine kinase [Flavobacteriaceae bacterium]